MARRCVGALFRDRQGAGADWFASSVDHTVSALSRGRRLLRRGMRQRGHLAALLRCDRDGRAEERRAFYAQRGPYGESRGTRSDPDGSFRRTIACPLARAAGGRERPVRTDRERGGGCAKSASQRTADDPKRGTFLV